jgi:hypothetical protein
VGDRVRSARCTRDQTDFGGAASTSIAVSGVCTRWPARTLHALRNSTSAVDLHHARSHEHLRFAAAGADPLQLQEPVELDEFVAELELECVHARDRTCWN